MVAFALLTLFAQSQAPPRDGRASAGIAATISGIVMTDEAQPRPLRHARVTLKGEALDADEAVMTGDDGTFAFEDLRSGMYELRAAKSAYITTAYGAARPGGGGAAARRTPRSARRRDHG